MTIAIYHGFPTMHHEMLGYLYDYCLRHDVAFDVYAHASAMWKPFYDACFGAREWLPPPSFEIAAYDRVVLVTDDDPSFPPHCFERFPDRIVSIDHCHLVRNGAVGARLCTRPTPADTPWAMPCYPLPAAAAEPPDGLHVALVGASNAPAGRRELRSLFRNHRDVTFHVMGYDVRVPECETIRCHRGIDAVRMFRILGACSHVLCFLRGKDFTHSVLSGAIPLAYTAGCRLIMPGPAREQLGLSSPLSIADVRGTTLRAPGVDEVRRVRLERDRLVRHRDRMLDRALGRAARGGAGRG